MQSTLCQSFAKRTRMPAPTSRSSRTWVTSAAAGHAVDYAPKRTTRRRSVGLLLALPALLGPKVAQAEDVSSAKGAAAERKAELRQTAQQIKSTGQDQEAFPDSNFAEQEATTRGGKSDGSQKPRQEDSIQPSPFSAPK